MKDSDWNANNLDAAIAAIKAEQPSQAEIAGAAERVRNTLNHARGAQLNSIDDYLAAIPDYLADRLSPAQKLLFEEESRQSIPLRRALNAARVQDAQQQETPVKKQWHYRRWIASAAALFVVVTAGLFVVPEMPSLDQTQLAQIEEVNGTLYQVIDGRLNELSPGTWIDGQQGVRTAKNSTALLTLDDGSRIELNGRSELSVTRRGKGNRINVERGQIIVAASPQGSGRLDVATNEFIVSVKGTIFEVGHGTQGSRVGVIEGEVQVHQEGDSTSLTPGEQLGSRTGLTAFAKLDQIAWSRDADRYIAMLQDVTQLQREIEAAMATAPRYSTRLLDMAPADTAVYVAVPNAPEKIAEVYQLVRNRMQQSESLAREWEKLDADDGAQTLDQVMTWLAEAGSHLGEETVFSLVLKNTATGTTGVPVILSEVDAESFKASFEQQVQQFRQARATVDNRGDFDMTLVDHPSQAIDGHLSIWLHEDLLIASSKAATLQAMVPVLEAGRSGFAGSKLHALLENSYRDGAQFLGAVHLAKFFALGGKVSDEDSERLKAVGLHNAEFLLAHRQQGLDSATLTADLLFAGNRSGAMSWLAEPGPMGSLEFFSTDATIVNALILRDPAVIFDELIALDSVLESANTASNQGSTSPNNVLRLDLRDDLLATLGGEVAFGLDGPTLPTPAWKVVMEIYDQQRLQQSIERTVNAIDRMLDAQSRGGVTITRADVGYYPGYQLTLPVNLAAFGGETSGQSQSTFNYAYVEGYMVLAPNLAMLERAVQQYQSGISVLTDAEFQQMLPRSGSLDFSAVSFNRIGELLSGIGNRLPSLTEQQRQAIEQLNSASGASFYSLTASPDSIRFFQNGSSLLGSGFSSLMGLYSMLGMAEGNDLLNDTHNEHNTEVETY